MSYPKVILVDSNDEYKGEMEKMEAHQKGLLHRAFSILIFNTKGEMLIHRRSESKYHSPKLWTNACCSHPQPNENIIQSAKKRLMQEMGIQADLKFLFKFEYRTDFENGLIEHELDHVFVGITDNLPEINPSEVSEYKYISMNQLVESLNTSPENFTFWFKKIMDIYQVEVLVQNG